MTDMEIMQAAVEGAWPTGAHPQGPVHELLDARLWRDSGLGWLLHGYWQVRIYQPNESYPVFNIIVADFHVERGPTLLSAIHSAIQALSKPKE